MDRKELLEIRQEVYQMYEKRKALGEFDANSEAILLCIKTLVNLMDHELEGMRRVHSAAKPKAG